ncbi:hypothetical protein FH608_038665 [Nonomuraea phyllanthi]|uniref:Uncharacterized protein n=1 Tax=Nonomuraea phyllanthi TaxID=2219224 RepID=A0A5C4VMI6_9ACTN|nr:hypothetical protein [Nonomuraea phyllanthi]KAB8189527.1 hypothetical protein FH608_038665 [Nonomuraea phyllanthi]QFY12120.1 hypothetical protein GBF35_41050 [Nonomuraea phyllanthi]
MQCPHEDTILPTAKPASAIRATPSPPNPSPAPRTIEITKADVDEFAAKIQVAAVEAGALSGERCAGQGRRGRWLSTMGMFEQRLDGRPWSRLDVRQEDFGAA